MAANKSAALSISLSYTGPDGDEVSMPQRTIPCNYQAQNSGTMDVPDTTAMTTAFVIPFGGINVLSTCGIIENKTGQPMGVKINGAAAISNTVPDGGILTWGFPGSLGATPILAVSLITTAVQAGIGYINYHLFGDPT